METTKIEKFKAFAKTAKTRAGVKFKCEVFQVNQEGEPSSVRGKIFVQGEDKKESPIEMLWDLNGVAMLIGPAYDLIKEIPFK